MEIAKSMTNEEKILLCLFSKLGEEHLFPSGSIPTLNSYQLIKILKKNKLLRRAAYEFSVLKRYPEVVDSFLSNRFRKLLLLWEQENTIYRNTLSFVEDEFKKRNIDSCLLKGLSLYTEGLPRDMGDLDILINEKDLFTAIDILKSAGFIYVGDRRKAFLRSYEWGGNFKALIKWSNQFEFLNEKSGLLVELHTNVFERKRVYSFNMDPIWNNVSQIMDRKIFSEDLQCYVPCPEDRLWLLAMHNGIRQTHTRGSFVFRYLLDMFEQIKNNPINWEELIEYSKKTSTSGFIYFSLNMCNHFFPGLIDQTVIKNLYNHLSSLQGRLHYIQLRCFHSMTSGRRFYVLLFNILLPFCYHGSFADKLKSIFIVPHLVRSRRQLARIYGVDSYSAIIPFLYLCEPFRIIYSFFNKHNARKRVGSDE